MTERRVCLEDGKCLDDCCEPCVEFRQAHSSLGGKYAAYKEIIGFIQQEAKELWIQGGEREATGKAFRSLAERIKILADPIEKELNACIRASEKQRSSGARS